MTSTSRTTPVGAVRPMSSGSGLRPNAIDLAWFPADPQWLGRLKDLENGGPSAEAWLALVALANTRMDFIRTARLDRSLRKLFSAEPPANLATKPVRLAILGSSTVAHLLAPIRVAALRRGIWLSTYETGYGQYMQELSDPRSGLHRFRPNNVLFAFDTRHVLRGLDPSASPAQASSFLAAATSHLRDCWCLARDEFHCAVMQQTLLPVSDLLLGSNEHRLPGSPYQMTERLNITLRQLADSDNAHLVAVDVRAARDGLDRWYDPGLWHQAKQEISPAAGPLYGELVGRLIAAEQGLSKKCLVLDLDNTLWGGVIGDDGVEGILLGNGSALGEAYSAFQAYAANLTKRGIILAVCSKNDEANALAPFSEHPEMVLKREDIACFVANWSDKATNIRAIAKSLNIGLDSLVLLDDNPFERDLVRRELPMVAVPEIPEDPALYASWISDAGYFEALAVTEEDRERTGQYRANIERESLAAIATDLTSYLRGLDMRLHWASFDNVSLQRIVQLINKTNQFNLTTRRYSEGDIRLLMDDPNAVGLQFRLIDRFGDNGIIAIVIGRLAGQGDLVLDTWLMSCRVLGRQVEEAILAVVAEQARMRGARRLIGEYRPSVKNLMVKEHYMKLGFSETHRAPDDSSVSVLELSNFTPKVVLMNIVGMPNDEKI